jgi:2-(1,2-epoxy-1,2-dihydrophenyl)acetyl-CoA isomerase
MEYTTLIVEKKEHIGTVKFNRPEKLNAMSNQGFDEFVQALLAMDRDDEVRVVIVTGAGRAFSAGLDLNEARKNLEAGFSVVPVQGTIAWIAHIIRNMTKPVIAALNGLAVGGGFTIALACDIRIASEEAQLSAAFLRVGLVPEFGSTYNLPRLVGIAKACELVFTGKTLGAKEAREIGLVNEVVPKSELEAVTNKMAAEIVQVAPIALKLAKQALYQGLDADLVTQIKFETLGQSVCFGSEDFKEGMQAFAEKRKPVFKGK